RPPRVPRRPPPDPRGPQPHHAGERDLLAQGAGLPGRGEPAAQGRWPGGGGGGAADGGAAAAALPDALRSRLRTFGAGRWRETPEVTFARRGGVLRPRAARGR